MTLLLKKALSWTFILRVKSDLKMLLLNSLKNLKVKRREPLTFYLSILEELVEYLLSQ